jgi:signal transduction histidine kinase
MDSPARFSQYLGVRRRLLLALVGIVTPVYVVLFASDLTTSEFQVAGLLWALVVPSLVVGGVVLLLRRPEHPLGELLVATGLAAFVIPAVIEALIVAAFDRIGAQAWLWAPVWLTRTVTNLGLVLATTLVVLLPDGQFRYPRERRFIAGSWAVVALPILVVLSNEVIVTSGYSFAGLEGIRNPLFIEALRPYGPIFVSLNALASLVFLGAMALLFMRYRAASGREQKQIRWVLLAGVVVLLVAVIPSVLANLGVTPPLEDRSAETVLSLLALLLLPASIVVAVMEPPWIDVDIVIRRSVVYGALSLVILVAYIAVAASVGVAAGARLGLSVELAVVLTVVVAILFQPARQRLQALADRWVFGARPTKYEAVTDFGVTIEQVTEPSDLLPPLVETIKRALRLTWVTASLDDGSRAATGAATRDAVLRVPLRAGDERVGEIVCGPKTEGPLGDDDIQLVRTLAGQLALAVRNARLAGRIVNAAESERRRIERNIHDGAQQELVALVAQLGMARSTAVQGGLHPDVIDDLRLEAQHILSELRELAQGIHPSVLSDGGILEAVEDRCAKLPLEVTLEASEGLRARRFDDNIEGAAYFFVTESLANVLKHADASRATISLTYDDDRLQLGVADNGRGFDPEATAEGGLMGLRDRIRALGGTVSVASKPGSGTIVSAVLPANGP